MTERSRTRLQRPAKPYPDFPLFPHVTGRWAKKIRGKFVFFGPWRDPHGALERYESQRHELYTGVSVRRGAPATTGMGGDGGAGAVGAEAGGQAETGLAIAAVALAVDGGKVRRGARGRGEGSGRDGGWGGGGGGGEGPTVRDLVNHYLTAKTRRLESGEMGLRSFSEQHKTSGRLVRFFGADRRVSELTSQDFGLLRADIARSRGPVALGNEVGRVRSIFKFGFEAGLVESPVRFGPEFCKPPKRSMRIARRARGAKMFEPKEVQGLLDHAGEQLRAMILLGLNAGLGNTDVADLKTGMLDLNAGMLDYPRPKTGIARRCPLWPETVAAIKRALKGRPKAKSKEDADLVFVTKYGQRWVRVSEPGGRSKGKNEGVVKDAVGTQFSKVIVSAGLEREGRGFYALRHTFRTVADEVGDRPAVDMIMGHERSGDIATAYVERIADERLRRVVEHVRGWAFGGR